ncbi:hypothetical protein [Drancourtella sp. An12]|nr:hypothetical protein [Drancourtella sp. An12]
MNERKQGRRNFREEEGICPKGNRFSRFGREFEMIIDLKGRYAIIKTND